MLVWLIITGGCIVVAGLLAWRRDFNAAFVVAALGLVSWLLNYRGQMKLVRDAADAERETNQEEPDESEGQ